MTSAYQAVDEAQYAPCHPREELLGSVLEGFEAHCPVCGLVWDRRHVPALAVIAAATATAAAGGVPRPRPALDDDIARQEVALR